MAESEEPEKLDLIRITDQSVELPHLYEIQDHQREISIKDLRRILADHHAWLKQTRGEATFPPHWDRFLDGWLEQSKNPKRADLKNTFFPRRAPENGLMTANDFRFPDDLYEVDFSGSNLAGHYFGFSNLDGCSFGRAVIGSISFHSSSLIRCDFRNCYAANADFQGANLSRADFRGAYLKDVRFYEFEKFDDLAIARGGMFVPGFNKATVVRDADFSGATELDPGQLFWLNFCGAKLDQGQKRIAKIFEHEAIERGCAKLKGQEQPSLPQDSSAQTARDSYKPG
jgi:uncharacterized protein YjbI with pentapeptide repeats